MAQKTKNLGGRPSKKDSLDMEMLKKMYLLGLTDKQVADVIGVTKQTIGNWKNKDAKFFASIKECKNKADKRVVKSLLKRALGYKYNEVTYEKSKTGGLGIKLSKGEIKEIAHTDVNKTKVITKEMAADVTACIFWLKNRKPEDWRDKREVENTGTVDFKIKVNEVDLEERRNLIQNRLSECQN